MQPLRTSRYHAQWGRYWELDCGQGGILRIRAAQLQHRLPCWGYVFEELLPQKQTGKKHDLAKMTSEGRKVRYMMGFNLLKGSSK